MVFGREQKRIREKRREGEGEEEEEEKRRRKKEEGRRKKEEGRRKETRDQRYGFVWFSMDSSMKLVWNLYGIVYMDFFYGYFVGGLAYLFFV